MATHRFLVPHENTPRLDAGANIMLPEEEAHHARTVLRLRVGDTVELFDGAGRVAHGCLAELDRKRVSVTIEGVTDVPPLLPHVAIAFAPPKGKRTPATVEALTELGADELIPLTTARSVAEGGSPEKWRAKAVEACKQCGRAWLPTIADAYTVDALLARADEYDVLCVASLTPDALDADGLARALATARRVLWCVGPEGGWTDDEEMLLARAGARPVRVAPHVLRIGTAAELVTGLTRFLAARP